MSVILLVNPKRQVDSFKKATKNLLKVKTESNVTDKYSEKQEKKKETPDGKLPKSFIV